MKLPRPEFCCRAESCFYSEEVSQKQTIGHSFTPALVLVSAVAPWGSAKFPGSRHTAPPRHHPRTRVFFALKTPQTIPHPPQSRAQGRSPEGQEEAALGESGTGEEPGRTARPLNRPQAPRSPATPAPPAASRDGSAGLPLRLRPHLRDPSRDAGQGRSRPARPTHERGGGGHPRLSSRLSTGGGRRP